MQFTRLPHSASSTRSDGNILIPLLKKINFETYLRGGTTKQSQLLGRHCEEAKSRRGNLELLIWIATLRSQ